MLFLAAALALGDTQADVLELFRGAAEALTQKNADGFVEIFDKDMPGYATLRGEIEALAMMDVGSAIEVVSDEGDEQKRDVELDWVLEVGDQRARRGIVKCRVERRGKKWKVVGLDPVEFFKN